MCSAAMWTTRSPGWSTRSGDRRTEGEKVRLHLVELFDVVGAQDPRVAAARLKLANALF